MSNVKRFLVADISYTQTSRNNAFNDHLSPFNATFSLYSSAGWTNTMVGEKLTRMAQIISAL